MIEKVDITECLPVLTLRNIVIFPGSVIPLGVGRPKTIQLIKECMAKDSLVLAITQKDPDIEDPTPNDLFKFGTVVRVVKLVEASADNFSVVVKGICRAEIDKFTQSLPYLKADMTIVNDSGADDPDVPASAISLKTMSKEVLDLIPELPTTAMRIFERVTDPSVLADLIASNLDATVEEKQNILECTDVKDRIHSVLELLTRQLEVFKLSDKITTQVKGAVSKIQREYYLRQQLKAIKDELGEGADEEDDLSELESKIDGSDFPEDVDTIVRKEFKRLRNMSSSQAEYTVSRTYIDLLCDIPWLISSVDRLDLDRVKDVLELDHFGLEDIKKRIIEFLAVRKLRNNVKGPILCLVGPPGTGKTSLGQSIAKAMGRKFVRVSLGGVRDESEIRGHRRTYIGAMPGRIVKSLKKCGTNNPVVILDEIDKLASDFRGDPSSALLEVLDPEQNNTFADNYLDTPIDLSKCLFIATANQLGPIAPALMDRLEIIEVSGYTTEEKVEIAKKHLIPESLKDHGLTEKECIIETEAIVELIRSHTREAGVRGLKRVIASVLRSVAVSIVNGECDLTSIIKEDLFEILGPEKFINEVAQRTDISGVTTGLAWTATGGDILFIETTKTPGEGKLKLTGKLGDVMKESAEIALTLVHSVAVDWDIPLEVFKENNLHIHVPAGAVPKDGPSAGVTLVTSIVSLLTNRKVRADVAMTGEISLRGTVMPVGGIKEKVLAAKRAGIKTIIIPERNKKDLHKIPDHNIEGVEFIFAKRFEDVLEVALLPKEEE